MRFNMAPPSKGAPMSSSEVLLLRGREREAESDLRSFMRAAGCWRWCWENDCEEAEAGSGVLGTTESLAGRTGDRLCKRVAEGGYRGDVSLVELLVDAFEVAVLATGALGARLRLVELRLPWTEPESMRPSMLKAPLW